MGELSLAMTGLDESRETPAKTLLRSIAGLGYAAVQIDGTYPGLRARELDRSARREVAAILRREEVALSGIDLWIPPAHFTSVEHVDRAIGAVRGAAGLCADLARLTGDDAGVLSLELPEGSEQVRVEVSRLAEGLGVRVADHRVGADPASGWVGIDPAACLLAGQDPGAVALVAGDRLASARLSDASSLGRVAPIGHGGRLDAMAYRASLEIGGYRRPITVDLRGVRDAVGTAPEVVGAWRALMGSP